MTDSGRIALLEENLVIQPVQEAPTEVRIVYSWTLVSCDSILLVILPIEVLRQEFVVHIDHVLVLSKVMLALVDRGRLVWRSLSLQWVSVLLVSVRQTV